MLLSSVLNKILEIAKNNNLSTPYIVGGIPRDKLFGFKTEVKDIDVTTGDSDSFALAILSSKIWPKANFKTFDDGHSRLEFRNIFLDYSNNFKLPNINEYLNKSNIKNINSLKEEMYSRDFTINCLLQPLDLNEEIIDITGFGKKDIERKILRTPVDPELTIGYDPRRILRALKMALKFDLKIANDLKNIIIKYRGMVSNLPLNSVKKQVNQMLEMDSKKTIEILSEYKLLPIIPLSKMMNLELAKNHMIQYLL